MNEFSIQVMVDDFLSDTVASHKRRVAMRQGNREPDTIGCEHVNWNLVREWCEDCGITAVERMING